MSVLQHLQAISLSHLKLLKFDNKSFCLKVKGENVFSVKGLECGEDVALATFRQHLRPKAL